MAVDPNDDTHDDKHDEDEDEFVPIKRQPKSLIASKSLPSVESALDDFIISANQKLMDVAEFTPETREQGLRDEIAELKKKLAAAEAKVAAVAATEAPAPVEGGRSWGAIIGAFVVGVGVMFAVGKLTASDAPRPAADAPATAVAPTQPQTSPTPAADPVAHEPSAPTSPPVAVTPPSEPVATPTSAPKQPTVAAKQPAKQPKQPKQPPTPKQPNQPTAGQDGSASKPPPAGDGSGSDLYNPF